MILQDFDRVVQGISLEKQSSQQYPYESLIHLSKYHYTNKLVVFEFSNLFQTWASSFLDDRGKLALFYESGQSLKLKFKKNMKSQNQGSCNSTPFNPNKENVCPNHNYHTSIPFFQKDKREPRSNSIKTDSEFNMFKTINVPRQSSSNTVGTKSRMEMQAVLETFSTKSQTKRRISQYSHRSFLELLGLAFGKEEFSVEEAIEKCEEFGISGRQQLLSLMDQKEPSRQWPLPLSNLLLTDLGHLKVMKLCQHIQNEQDLSDRELQILQFLVPNFDTVELVDRTAILDRYNQFRNQIEEKCGLVDELVKSYTLRVQPKIKRISDKVALIKMQRKIKRFSKTNNGVISFSELKNCMELFQLTEQEIVLVFRYIYFIDNEKIVTLVDRKLTVSCETCLRELINKDQTNEPKPTLSTLQTYEEENTQVINQLLSDKNYLLEAIQNQQGEIQKLKNHVMMLQMQLNSNQKLAREERERQLANMRKRYQKKLQGLQQENKAKDNMIRWYQNELAAVVDQNKRQFIASNRHRVFYKVIKAGPGEGSMCSSLEDSFASERSKTEEEID